MAGTGLGLAIVKRLVKLMNGAMTLKSTPGRGTSVSFTLPLAVSEEAPSDLPDESAEAQVEDASGRPLRVLVVEDNPVNQLAVNEYLQDFGHEVAMAENGRQALELLDENDFDLILMDVQMPEMDGIETTARIRTGQANCVPDIPIIALSAYAMSEDREKFLAAGMDDHVTKPEIFGSLSGAIRKVLRKKGLE